MADEQEDEEVVAPLIISAESFTVQDRVTIDQQIATAHAYPRNVKRATENSIALVTMDPETAATCTYTVPRGGKRISGPSVHLAKVIAQNWGNMRIDAKVTDIGEKVITSTAVAWDLESNLAIKIEVKRSIWSAKKGRYREDLIVTNGNAANAIALRNAIYAVIPKSVVNKTYKAARATIAGDVSTDQKLIARRKEVVDSLKGSYDVTEKEILEAIGRASISHITPDDIVDLIGIGTAIKDGDTTIDMAFRNQKAPEAPAPGAKENERLFALIKEAKTLGDLVKFKKHLKPEHLDAYNQKEVDLTAPVK